MSGSQALALDAVALQLRAALDQYEADVNGMVDEWLDMERYHAVSEQIERIRQYSAALPALRVQWMELLIAHAELVHSLWRRRFQEVDADRQLLAQSRERHARCVQSLRERCLRMAARGPEAS